MSSCLLDLLLVLSMTRPAPSSTLFPYTTLFRSSTMRRARSAFAATPAGSFMRDTPRAMLRTSGSSSTRSEEHTSELQSPCNLVCRLLLEKKKDYTPRRRHRVRLHIYWRAVEHRA